LDKVLVSDRASLAVQSALGKERVTIQPSPVAALKALKNITEIAGFRAAHVRDGAALAKYFAWLEEALGKGEEVTEWGGAEVLEKYRA
jgi:Xaa-Pro aminopeptidase